ncbi:MAG: hypothetical protein ABH885_06365 [Candidatus Omnitrophota bacterium]
MTKLIFLDSEGDAESYARMVDGVGRDNGAFCVAMKPSVRSFAARKGLSAAGTGRYFSNVSHKRALEKSDEIVKWLRSREFVSDTDMGVGAAYMNAFIFWVRQVAHYLIWASEITVNAFDAHDPDLVYCPLEGGMPCESNYVETSERLIGRIIKRAAEARGRKIVLKNIPVNISGRAGTGSGLGRNGRYIYRYLRFRAWMYVTALRFAVSRKRPVILTSVLYQMDRLAMELKTLVRDRGVAVMKSAVTAVFIIPDVVVRFILGRAAASVLRQKAAIKKMEDAILSRPDIFSYRGVRFNDILAAKVKDSISNHIFSLLIWTREAARFLDLVRPGIIISNGTRDDDTVLAELCLRRHIPSVLVSHGSHVPVKSELERIEWGEHGMGLLRAPFSHLALQSPLAEAYRGQFPTPAVSLKTGPLLWGRAARKSGREAFLTRMFGGRLDGNKTNIIVHAGTPKCSPYIRFHVYETPDEYMAAVKDLAEAVQKIPDTALVVKFRPSKEISVSDMEALIKKYDKSVLSVDEAFSDVLGMADILASFSSTTIEEALQNRVPVLLYGGGGRYQHVQAGGAVHHADDPDEIVRAIKCIFESKGKAASGTDLFSPYVYGTAERVLFSDFIGRSAG